MENNTKKTNWGKIAIGAGITFVVVLAALAAHDKFVQPMLTAKK